MSHLWSPLLTLFLRYSAEGGLWQPWAVCPGDSDSTGVLGCEVSRSFLLHSSMGKRADVTIDTESQGPTWGREWQPPPMGITHISARKMETLGVSTDCWFACWS